MDPDSKPTIDTIEAAHIKSQDTENASAARVIDNIRVVGLTEDEADFYASFSPDRRKKLVTKVAPLECNTWTVRPETDVHPMAD